MSHYVDHQACLGSVAVAILFPPFLIGLVTAIHQEKSRARAQSLVVLAAGLLFAVCAMLGNALQGATAYLVVRSTNPA